MRAYCVASGSLTLYLYDRILALFSSAPYRSPESDRLQDLSAHLTNTSLQTHPSEYAVRLLDELVGCRILSGNSNAKLTSADVSFIVGQMVDILAETFKAALDTPVHFQVRPSTSQEEYQQALQDAPECFRAVRDRFPYFTQSASLCSVSSEAIRS